MLLPLVSLSGAWARVLGCTVQDTANRLIKTEGRMIRDDPLLRILQTNTFHHLLNTKLKLKKNKLKLRT